MNAGFGALFYDGFSMNDTAVLAPMIAGGLRVPVGESASVNMSLGYQHEANANGDQTRRDTICTKAARAAEGDLRGPSRCGG